MSEKIILRAKPSVLPTLILVPAAGILLACPILFVGLTVFREVEALAGLMIVLALLALTATVFVVGAGILRREYTTYTLTDQQLVIQQGVLKPTRKTIAIRQIQGTLVRYPFTGPQFDFGTLVVITDEPEIHLTLLPHPAKWDSELRRLMDAAL